MNYAKIGRNDPCPCGSGKKYKKCCGRLSDGIVPDTEPFTRANQLLATLKLKLDRFQGQEIKKARTDLKRRFLHYTASQVLPKENESLFSDWLWFDVMDQTGKTMGEIYMEENGAFLDPPIHECLQALNGSYLSLYVPGTTEGLELEVKDVLTGGIHKILLKEPWTMEAACQPLFLARLVKMDIGLLFSGMVLMLDNKSGEETLLAENLNFLADLHQSPMEEYLKSHGEQVYGIFQQVLQKQAIPMNHMEYTLVANGAAPELLKRLEQHADWVKDHNSAGFSWFKPRLEKEGYVRLAVNDEYLISCADLLRDVMDIRQMIPAIYPKGTFRLLYNHFADYPAEDFNYDLWFTVVQNQEFERWLQTPGEDDKKPQDLLQEPGGMEHLLAAIDKTRKNLKQEEELKLLDYIQERLMHWPG